MAKRKLEATSLLKLTRKKLDLSQTDLGRGLGVTRNTIRSWEAGPDQMFIYHICRGLQATRVMPHLFHQLTGPCLAEARGRMGLQQEQLAELIGVSRSTISRWENDTPPLWLSYALLSLLFQDQ